MNRIKRILALLMCMCMLFTYGDLTAYAMQNTEIADGEEQTDTGQMDATATDAEYTETASSETAQVGINYLVLGSSYIETSEEQFILVDIGDGSTYIENACVNYINETTGVSMSQNAGLIDGSSVVFYMSFPDSSYSGSYRIVSVDYTIAGQNYTIRLADLEMSAVFGVNQEVDGDVPYAWIVDDSASIYDLATVQMSDAQGNELDGISLSALTDDISIEEQGLVKGYDGKIVITLNPGHAADDTGASCTWNGVTYIERDLNLKIAQYCKAELDKYDNVEVYLSRTDNVTDWSIADMVSFAKSKKADLYISIHLNSNESSSPNGAEVWIPHGDSEYKEYVHDTSEGLANEILKKLVALGLTNRGVKIRYSESGKEPYPDGSVADWYGELYQTKLAGIPGMIVEHAFISNQQDAETYLSSEEKLKALGQADAQAIIEYISNNTIEHHHNDIDNFEVIYGGVNYSAVYDYNYYINKYPDLKQAFGDNDYKALVHFVNYGMKEGRQAKESFDVKSYRNRYQDLRSVFGTDLKKYYLHYISNGVKEGRQATGAVSIQNPVTTYGGVDYSVVYDYNYYINKYPDLKNAFDGDDAGAIRHFVNNGMKEGRQAKETFDVKSYRNRYQDLRKVYGMDLKKYYLHYINYGVKEGRQATGVVSIENPITTYGGVDYSAVYDYNYYINKYPDLKNAFDGDDEGALAHFVNNGMREGRQAKETFDVKSYRNKYQDLRRVYGTDLKKYYLHYINYGVKEGRQATGTTSMQNIITTYDGVDYSAVYDYNYYINKYPNLKKEFDGDDAGAIRHFVNYGMNAGEQAKAEFNVKWYKANYNDLYKTFGDNLPSYYLHYIQNGQREGRVADGASANATQTAIMGKTTTNVQQMAAYYRANAKYPSYYANTDAPTIEALCQIYIEECTVEGVDAEIAFCQAMKETGFLRYGGAVRIEQFNFAGIGATDDGGTPATFDTVRLGVRAQVQHLKAYASKDALKNPCVDPRFTLVTRGTAPYVEWLGIQENPYGKGWASAKNYGYSIMGDYVEKLWRY